MDFVDFVNRLERHFRYESEFRPVFNSLTNVDADNLQLTMVWYGLSEEDVHPLDVRDAIIDFLDKSGELSFFEEIHAKIESHPNKLHLNVIFLMGDS